MDKNKKPYHKYTYNGPIFIEDEWMCDWKGETYAQSEGKARSNLAYQWKRETYQSSNTRVFLPGKIIKE